MRRLLLAGALALAGCGGGAQVQEQDGHPAPEIVPANIESIPDAQPVAAPRSRYGNPPHYEVFGERYFVLSSAAGYKERGRASWYGTKFHGRRTSSGEPYDMFAMTAAHKTLPLPTYVRVTNVANGRSVVVKVNDRGPFHAGRIIDLSYAAAVKLDVVQHGSAEVIVEAIEPAAGPAIATPATPAPRFLEVAATDDPVYAVALREEVARIGVTAVEIRSTDRGETVLHRVLAGPFDAAALEAARQRLIAARLAARPVEQ